MNNQNDPWGRPSKNNQDDNSNKGQESGPPDLDEIFRNVWNKVSKGKNKSNGSSNEEKPELPLIKLLIAFLVGASIIWGGAGFYVIDEQERAVILRLGSYSNTLNPGLQWQPYFIDRVTVVNVTSVRDKISNSTMLTRDENIIDMQLQVQYMVNDPKFFVLNIRNPEMVLSLATDSALRHVVGSTTLDDAITTGRREVANKVHSRLQEYLNKYKSGIDIRKVNVSASKAPDEVKAAFDDVIKAREDKVRLVNEANAYENAIVPIARGNAQRVLEDAKGYEESVVARAKGDTERFSQLLNEYRKAPEVTRNRMYIGTMEEVLGGTNKVLIDVKNGNSLMYLPIDQLLKNNASSSSNSNSQTQAGDFSTENSVEMRDSLQRSIRSKRESR